MISMDLTNQVAMVTGAGGGIGRALSLDLAGLGADMVLTCRTSRTQCEELARVHTSGGYLKFTGLRPHGGGGAGILRRPGGNPGE